MINDACLTVHVYGGGVYIRNQSKHSLQPEFDLDLVRHSVPDGGQCCYQGTMFMSQFNLLASRKCVRLFSTSQV